MGFTSWKRNPEMGACDWCLMLAGRGAVYSSRDAAGGDDPYHDNCKCDANMDVQFEDGDTPTDWSGLRQFAMLKGGQIAANRAAVEAAQFATRRLLRSDVYEEMLPPVTTLAVSTLLPTSPLTAGSIEVGRALANRRIGVRRAPRLVQELEQIEEDIERPLQPALRAVDAVTGGVIDTAQSTARAARLWEGVVTGRILDEAVQIDRTILLWQERRRARGQGFTAASPAATGPALRSHSAFPFGNPYRAEGDFDVEDFKASIRSLWGESQVDDSLIEVLEPQIITNRTNGTSVRFHMKKQASSDAPASFNVAFDVDEMRGTRIMRVVGYRPFDRVADRRYTEAFWRSLAEEWNADRVLLESPLVTPAQAARAPAPGALDVGSNWGWDLVDQRTQEALVGIVRAHYPKLRQGYLDEGWDTEILDHLNNVDTRAWAMDPDLVSPTRLYQILGDDMGYVEEANLRALYRYNGPYSPRNALDPRVRLRQRGAGTAAPKKTYAEPKQKPQHMVEPGTGTPWRTRISYYLDESNPRGGDFDEAAFSDVVERHVNDALDGTGYRLVSTDVDPWGDINGEQAIKASFAVQDVSTGRNVGTMTRSFATNDSYVYHDYFQISPDVRGGGVGSKITESMDALYEAWGYETVGVHADIDIGAYHWAVRGGFDWERSGYDDFFHDDPDHANAGFIVDMMVAAYRQGGQVRDDAEALLYHRLGEHIDDPDYLRSAYSDDEVLAVSPFDLAHIGESAKQVDNYSGKDRWWGKDYLISKGQPGWFGTRTIAPLLEEMPDVSTPTIKVRLNYSIDDFSEALRSQSGNFDPVPVRADPDDPHINIFDWEFGNVEAQITLRNDGTASVSWGDARIVDEGDWYEYNLAEQSIARALKEQGFSRVSMNATRDVSDAISDRPDFYRWDTTLPEIIEDNAATVRRMVGRLGDSYCQRYGLPTRAEARAMDDEMLLRKINYQTYSKHRMYERIVQGHVRVDYDPSNFDYMTTARQQAQHQRQQWAVNHASDTAQGRTQRLITTGHYHLGVVRQRMQAELSRALSKQLRNVVEERKRGLAAAVEFSEVTQAAPIFEEMRKRGLDYSDMASTLASEGWGDMSHGLNDLEAWARKHGEEWIVERVTEARRAPMDEGVEDAMQMLNAAIAEQRSTETSTVVANYFRAQDDVRAYERQYQQSLARVQETEQSAQAILEYRLLTEAFDEAGLKTEMLTFLREGGNMSTSVVSSRRLSVALVRDEMAARGGQSPIPTIDVLRIANAVEERSKKIVQTASTGDTAELRSLLPPALFDKYDTAAVRYESDLRRRSEAKQAYNDAQGILYDLFGGGPRTSDTIAEALAAATRNHLEDALGPQWANGVMPKFEVTSMSPDLMPVFEGIQETVESTMARMPSRWGYSWMQRIGGGNVRVELGAEGGGWNTRFGEVLRLPHPALGEGEVRTTWAHEAYHSVEAHPTILQAEREYLARRAQLQQALADDSPLMYHLSAMGSDQLGHEIAALAANFGQPYAGRIYQPGQGFAGQEAFEVLTVGIEGLLGGSRRSQQMADGTWDDEYLAWLLGLLISVRG